MKISEDQTLVLGPPGTGKTTHVLNQVDSLLQGGEAPDRIAFVSFTRKAVNEAVDRASDKFSLSKARLPLFKTIHAMCFAGLGVSKKDMMSREHYKELGEATGYAFEGTWDESEGIPIGSEKGDSLLFLDNLARITQRPLKELWEESDVDVEWEELEFFQDKYQDYKSATHVMDFTDLLYAYVAMCDPSQARHAFVDEAQDLSAAQWMVLQHAFSNTVKTTIAGDDDQAIYKWSGADVERFLTLEGTQTVLSQSYRLPRSIHEFSTNIVDKISRRFDKPFQPRTVEGDIQYANSLEFIQIEPEEQTLFLVRNTYIAQRVYDRLERLGIPYVNRHGWSSVKPAHVKAIYAVEKLRKGEPITGAEAKVMIDSLRIGYFLKHGSKTKASLLVDDKLYTFAELNAQHGVNDLAAWYTMLAGIGADTIEYYRAVLSNGYNLTHRPICSVSTIHAAKGGEANHVILLSDMAYRSYAEYESNPDDERRVAYVGVTRAKEKLTIVAPQGKLYFPYMKEGS
jgi:superfamily I DNA/RNA helicase